MHKLRAPKVVNKRCNALEEMGFVIYHEDSRVAHPDFPNVVFDFSAADIDKIFIEMGKQLYTRGHKDGVKETKSKFKGFFGWVFD